jgi:Ras family protein
LTSDDRPNLREVQKDEAEALAKERGLRWIETSAKSNDNVTKVFDMCLEEIDKSMHPRDPNAPATQDQDDKNGCIIM